MKLIDRSGGIWSRLIIRKASPDLVIRQSIVPDEKLTKSMASETINSIKGSTRSQFVVKRINGKLIHHRFPSGRYEYGILQRKTPEGEDYLPLKDTTLEIRKWKGVQRGAAFILRETSKHIFEGLKIKSFTLGPRGGKKVIIGWSGESEEIAVKQHYGDPLNLLRGRPAPIPPRPFRGFQRQLIETFGNIIRQI